MMTRLMLIMMMVLMLTVTAGTASAAKIPAASAATVATMRYQLRDLTTLSKGVSDPRLTGHIRKDLVRIKAILTTPVDQVDVVKAKRWMADTKADIRYAIEFQTMVAEVNRSIPIIEQGYQDGLLSEYKYEQVKKQIADFFTAADAAASDGRITGSDVQLMEG